MSTPQLPPDEGGGPLYGPGSPSGPPVTPPSGTPPPPPTGGPPIFPDPPDDPPEHPDQRNLLPIEDGDDLDGRTLQSVSSLGGDNFVSRLRAHAANHGIGPLAAACVSLYEGLHGGIGDGGCAYGPWQIHLTDGRLRKFVGRPRSDPRLNQWAWGDEGIDYAMRSMVAGGAKGKSGHDAIHAIVFNFERPLLMQSEADKADSAWDALHTQPDGGWSIIAKNAYGPKGGAPVTAPPPVSGQLPTEVGGAFAALLKSLAHTAPNAGNHASNVGGKLMGIFK